MSVLANVTGQRVGWRKRYDRVLCKALRECVHIAMKFYDSIMSCHD